MSRRPRKERDLALLPKAELHLHLEGSMRRQTLVDLCARHSVSPVPPDTRNRRFDGFSAFVDVYVAACESLRDTSDLDRLVLEVAEDAASAGCRWIEPALSLTFYRGRFGGTEGTLRALCRAAERAENQTGVAMGFVLAVERQLPLSEAMHLAEVARTASASAPDPARGMTVHGRPGVVGFGLHGPEGGHPPAGFEEAFRVACGGGHGLKSVPHAGEIAPVPGGGARSVRDAVSVLNAERIGHGVLAAEDGPTLDLIVEKGICLDVCVTSNHLLRVVDGVVNHPLPRLIRRGVQCTINSDDSLLFGCDLSSEYELCRRQLGMTDEELVKCAAASFLHSSAPRELVDRALADIQAWLNDDPNAEEV